MRQTFVLATDGTQPEYLVQTAKEASHDHPPQPLPPQQTQAMNEIPTPRRDACYARAGMMLAHQVDELDKECCKLEAELTSAAKELAIYRTVLGLEDGDSIPLDQTPQYGNFLVDHAGSRSRRTPMNDEAIRLERELAKTSMQLTSALAREAAITQERDVAIEKLDKLNAVINSPETQDFLKAVPLEAAHQMSRWKDDDKTEQDWVFLFGWLAGKATQAAKDGNLEKAKHHAITASAALFNWHSQLSL